ncbi:dsDNA nuclease domain-containing protein [uncultured Shewanella sp.]|uniref:dsDNA nuclease domain-containing protein n=1 Tax=uncultured Shewanella sp. TaxID=173975 RepID=UPI0026174A27|nr:dsDNA nuclease domain-containing protein [uncultured Shewanella sp.]
MSTSEMELSDSGGPAALKGFVYQNFVTAYYVLRMLEDKNLLSVRCEVVDDVDAIYADKVEYIQVKTTDKDSKWNVSEFADAETKSVPPIGRQKKHQTISKEDSILHKSILCDKGKLPGYFRIVTPRDVTDSLKYLKTSLNIRNEKTELKASLLRRLSGCIERNRPNKSVPFISPNGNGIEYWLDHAEWEVIPLQEVLESRCTKLIRQAAQRKAIYLIENGDSERILCSLLNNLFKKGSASRVIKSIDDKSYLREDFISWFEAEIEHYAHLSGEHVKIYTTDSTRLEVVLSAFFQDNHLYEENGFNGRKECTGLKGEYYRRKYGYDLIARNLYKWFHEVLLLPNEIADHAPDKITDKFRLLTQRYTQEASFINNLVAKALLHSTVRTTYKTQPIAANLHIDGSNDTCFDNIHIILNAHQPDILLMGFSRLINKIDISSLANIVSEFNVLLESEAFSTQKEKVLLAKKDNYLLDHDINDILKANSSLDANLDRFRFVFFIGYESDHLQCHVKDMAVDYENHLKSEVIIQFKSLVNNMISADEFYEDLHVEAYLYPIPSLSSLISEIQTQVESKWKIA